MVTGKIALAERLKEVTITATPFTTADMRDRIFEFLLRPDCLSKKQRDSIRSAFAANDGDKERQVAKEILENIEGMDAYLREDLTAFTPHESCRVSLIRDVLLQVRERGQLATQPVKVVRELESVA